ncbi:MAG: hypothetical protein RJB66_558 [Pseudomonadota bacterium]|jgi:hypothetical protein
MKNWKLIALTVLITKLVLISDQAFARSVHPHQSTDLESAMEPTEIASYTELEDLNTMPSHLKYFGYYASGANPEVASHSNVYWILDGQGANTEAILAQLQKSKEDGLKAIVSLSGYFFQADFNLKDPAEYNQNWNTLAAQISPYVADGTILAFYPLDEPYNKLEKNRKTKKQMRQMLETIGSTIKTTFPGSLVAVIFGVDGKGFSGQVPRNYDWIGFDVYDCWDNCVGKSIPQIYEELKSNLTSADQKIFLVPDTWKWSLGLPSNNEIKKMITLFNKYVAFAKKKVRIIGMFNFIYQDLPSYDKKGNFKGYFPGTKSAPALLDKVKAVGIEIKQNNP